MEFACSVCHYTSDKKEHVTRHILKKKSCGPGLKEIVEIPNEINCEYCDKNFTTLAILKKHQKDSCKSRLDILEEKNKRQEEKIKELEKRPQQIDDKEDQSYIYLIKIYPYTDNIYKIGRTINILERLASYKRYKIVFITSCLNDVQCEKELLQLFRLKFTECKEMGSEYFYGEYQQMKRTIQDYF